MWHGSTSPEITSLRTQHLFGIILSFHKFNNLNLIGDILFSSLPPPTRIYNLSSFNWNWIKITALLMTACTIFITCEHEFHYQCKNPAHTAELVWGQIHQLSATTAPSNFQTVSMIILSVYKALHRSFQSN